MNTITSIVADIIQDSRGKDTVRVTAFSGDMQASFSVPSGASTGAHEAYELRDATGSVHSAIRAITETITPALIGRTVTDQRAIDTILCSLDQSPHKEHIGANSTLGVSGALLRLGAVVSDLPLHAYIRKTFSEVPLGGDPYPRCYFNLINGGKHAKTALAFQEYHIVPRLGSVKEDLAYARAVYDDLSAQIHSNYSATVIGDEGGYALDTQDVLLPLSLLEASVRACGKTEHISYALDVAASSFFEGDTYHYGGGVHSASELMQVYTTITSKWPCVSIEDPFDEESFTDFSLLRNTIPSLKVIGDDLTVTNTELLTRAVQEKAIDGLIIKPNQIGTISETVDAISLAHSRGLSCIISHRSGETMDDTIADIVVAFECFGLKSGAPSPRERMVKYQRLVEALAQ